MSEDSEEELTPEMLETFLRRLTDLEDLGGQCSIGIQRKALRLLDNLLKAKKENQ